MHGGKSNTKTLTHALPWLAGSYPLDWMDFMESGIFGFLMKNWIDSAKNIRASPKFAFRGQMDRCVAPNIFEISPFIFPRDFKQILAAPRNEFVAHTISRLTTVFVVVDKFPLFPCNLVEKSIKTVSHLVLRLFFKSAGKTYKYLLN